MNKKMKKHSRSHYVRLLVAALAALISVVTVISFSHSYTIPGWSELFSFVKADKEVPCEEDFVRFLDVGQGDSILISSNGYNALVDFGNKSDFGTELLDTLHGYGIERLDCVVLSHYDNDHVGGGSKIIQAIDTKYALLPELDDRSDNDFTNFQYAMENSHTEIHPVKLGSVINIGDFEITVLAYNKNAENSNDASVVLMAELDGKKFLLTGDIGASVEKQMLADKIDVSCDVYKASHHGSRNSNTIEFITAAAPKYGVLSVGLNNSYGHPHSEVIDNLAAVGAKIYRTDKMGDITFFIENGSIRVETEQ